MTDVGHVNALPLQPDGGSGSAPADVHRRRLAGLWSAASLVLLGVELLLFPVFVVVAGRTIPIYGNPVDPGAMSTANAIAVLAGGLAVLGIAVAAVSLRLAFTTRGVVAGVLNLLVLLQVIAMTVPR